MYMFINGFKTVENLQNNDKHMDTRYILIFIYPTWYNLTDLIIYLLVFVPTELVTEDVYLSLIKKIYLQNL